MLQPTPGTLYYAAQGPQLQHPQRQRWHFIRAIDNAMTALANVSIGWAARTLLAPLCRPFDVGGCAAGGEGSGEAALGGWGSVRCTVRIHTEDAHV